MTSRANIIKCTGLRTYSNELDTESGSLRQALNVNVDEKGVITPRRGFNDYAAPTSGVESTATNFVSQIMEYKKAILRQYSDKLEYEDSNGDFQAVTGTYNQALVGFRTKWQEASSNLYFTSDEGIKKISVANRAALNADMVTNSGGLKAGYASGIIVPTIGGFLPPSSKVAYRVVYGTKDASNNLIEGSPSSRFVVTNFSEEVVTYEKSNIDFVSSVGNQLKDNDYVIYNTSNTKYCIYFDIGGALDEPQTADTIGSTYIKVTIPSATATGFDNATIANITANVLSNNLANSTISLSGTDTVLITSTEEDDIADIGTPVTTDAVVMTSATVTPGVTTSGSSATVSITGVVPNDATTDYFYQVYRTGTISTSLALSIDEIDPGDEMNIVYESGLTTAEITAGEFTFTDTTPESFRAEGAPLYTNAVTGEGILQANEAPPIALDIELFRNYMFYANTKQRHKLELDVISVDNFISGSTRFIVGNSDTTRYYTFVGTTQVQDITITAVPDDGDYINLYSANDERQYYIYFGTSVDDPEVAGAVGYLIETAGLTTGAEVAALIETALLDNVDFNLSVASDVITFTHTNNGYTTGIIAPVFDAYSALVAYPKDSYILEAGYNFKSKLATTPGSGPDATPGDNTGWRYLANSITIAIPSTDGTGELAGTDEGGDVLLSGLVSVGQAIDETARSLVKIISQDIDSPVNAYYLSTGEDLPGNILLEARSLEDKTFYISIEEPSDTLIGEEFTPELPLSKEIEEFTGNGGTTTIKLTGHGLTTGDETFVGYFKDPSLPSDPDSFSNVYTVTVNDVDNFTIDVVTSALVVSFVPAFSTIFSPDVESDNETKANRIYFSKRNQPEAVPSVNYIDVGTQDGEIRRILALRDNLFILKDDGIFILSGTSAPDWSVRLLDNTKIIAPDSAVVLNNQIYCLTEQGITRISDSGVGVISRGIENLIDDVTNQENFSDNTFGIAYENDRAFIMFTQSDTTDTSATQAFRYNIFERTWTRWEYEATCGHVASRSNKLYLGNGDRNYISRERKDNERTDHSDRNFSTAISADGVSGTVLKLSSLVNVKVNDVIVQEQDVSITFINNRLLKKMDYFDTGVTPPVSSTMLASFGASDGDNLSDIMQAINDHLRGLDPTYITAKSFTLSNLRANTQLLVDELNTSGSITSIKSYKDPYDVQFEAYIKEIDAIRNLVTLHINRPFVEGSIDVYKGFTQTVEWNPQHFGDPSALKQISYITIMFDQNNFYEAVAKFGSDASQATVSVPFQGKGIGYWGDMPWGSPNHYWGGVGNDIPFRNPVPRGKQKCRYLSLTFEHKNAREDFRIVGISGEIRAISGRGYRNLG